MQFHGACLGILIWEWWLGHQDFIKAKSTIALILLVLGLIALALFYPFRRNR